MPRPIFHPADAGGIPQQLNNMHREKATPINERTKQTSLAMTGLETKYRFGGFMRYILPKYRYSSNVTYDHWDSMNRHLKRPEGDRYIQPSDGRLRNVYVQATEYVRENAAPNSSTWRRTHIRNVGPKALSIAYWPMSTAPVDANEWSLSDAVLVGVKWVPATIALAFVLPFRSILGQYRNNGHYEPVPYKYWPYMTTYRNDRENHPDRRIQQQLGSVATTQALKRNLMPQRLCFLTDGGGYVVDVVSGPIDYLFVAYYSEHFATEKQKVELLEMAETATRRAGLHAFWIAFKCLEEFEMAGPNGPHETRRFRPEIYQINDIVRLSHAVIIALPNPGRGREEEAWTEKLSEFGDRMWTFPEVLLSPNTTIDIYMAQQSKTPFTSITKANFPQYAWRDEYDARQLMDHFLGSLHLSRLEFAKIAVRCLLLRAKIAEEQMVDPELSSKLLLGDMAYCYQGLLRVRPVINTKDNEWEVLVKLSMENDSDQLFERMLSMLPKQNANDDFFTNEDEWDVQLWDIQPTVQVAGVDKNSVLIDGLKGGKIRWKSFRRMAYANRLGWKRAFARFFIRFNLGFLLIFLSIFLMSPLNGVLLMPFIFISCLVWLLTPYLIRVIYGGKVWGAQPHLFGFEGYMDIATTEAMIFGDCAGRLSWGVATSSLSRHCENSHGHCIGLDPMTDPIIRERVQRAARSGINDDKIFTLVDTGSMTVCMFSARRPPTALLVTGAEGGMQRAVLCSYDWKTGTMFRESVIRVETRALDTLFRVPRVKFGFRRPDTLSDTP